MTDGFARVLARPRPRSAPMEGSVSRGLRHRATLRQCASRAGNRQLGRRLHPSLPRPTKKRHRAKRAGRVFHSPTGRLGLRFTAAREAVSLFERFTDRARRVVVLAQEEARLLNHNYIGTEHILLGLIHEGEGVAAKALESLGISLEAVRSQVEEIIGQGGSSPSRAHPVHAARQEGARAVAARGAAARPQLHRHRAHPPRPHP